jgi:hypothetical protein
VGQSPNLYRYRLWTGEPIHPKVTGFDQYLRGLFLFGRFIKKVLAFYVSGTVQYRAIECCRFSVLENGSRLANERSSRGVMRRRNRQTGEDREGIQA